jgi:hypothetical protein
MLNANNEALREPLLANNGLNRSAEMRERIRFSEMRQQRQTEAEQNEVKKGIWTDVLFNILICMVVY